MLREIVIYENIRLVFVLDLTADFRVKTKLVDLKQPPSRKNLSIDSHIITHFFNDGILINFTDIEGET